MDVDQLGQSQLSVVVEHLRTLDGTAIALLEESLHAMAAGDHTRAPELDLAPLELDAEDAETRALVDLCNTMTMRLRGALDAYEALRLDLARALGDHSCLPQLRERLQSLNDNCLTDLDTGLQAMADGDLTYAAQPVTHPLRAAPGDALGDVGDVFNEMLARSRTALRSYDAVREDLRGTLGDRSCLDDLSAGLRSLQRHCLRDLEEALEALAEGTELTRRIAPATSPITVPEDTDPGELALLFNRALLRARTAVEHLAVAREVAP